MPLNKALFALALLFAAAPQEPDAGERARLLDRLFFPSPVLNFQFNLTAADLSGDTALTPEARIERALGALDPARPETRLALANVYAAAGETDASREEFEVLKTELDEKLRAEPDDLASLALLGETAFRFGVAFKNVEALKAADGYLRTVRTKEPRLARAAHALADLYLFLSLRVAVAGGAGDTAEPLAVAIESAEAAIELEPDEFRGHATLFLASWLSVISSASDDFDTLTERALELTDELKSARGLADDEDLVVGLADGLVASVVVGRCLQTSDPRGQWVDAVDDATFGEELVEHLGAIKSHRRFGPVARSLRWLVTYLARSEREAELLEEALELADEPLDVLAMKLSLAAWDEDWDAVDAYSGRISEGGYAAEVEILLGAIAGRRDDFAASLAHYARVIDEDEELPMARAGAAIARLLAGGELEEAKASLAAALEDDADLASAAFALGTVHALLGERDAALEWLDRAQRSARPRDFAMIEATRADVEAD